MDPWVCMFSLFLPLLSAKNYEQKSVKIKKMLIQLKKRICLKRIKMKNQNFCTFIACHQNNEFYPIF